MIHGSSIADNFPQPYASAIDPDEPRMRCRTAQMPSNRLSLSGERANEPLTECTLVESKIIEYRAGHELQTLPPYT